MADAQNYEEYDPDNPIFESEDDFLKQLRDQNIEAVEFNKQLAFVEQEVKDNQRYLDDQFADIEEQLRFIEEELKTQDDIIQNNNQD